MKQAEANRITKIVHDADKHLEMLQKHHLTQKWELVHKHRTQALNTMTDRVDAKWFSPDNPPLQEGIDAWSK